MTPRQFKVVVFTNALTLPCTAFTLSGTSPEDVILRISVNAGIFVKTGESTIFLPWGMVTSVEATEITRMQDVIREGAV